MRTTRLVILVVVATAAACGERGGQEAILDGHASFRRGEFAQALRCYDRALEQDPDVLEALEGRGRALTELERLDEALANFDRVVDLLPGASSAHFNRGSVLSGISLRFEGEAETRLLSEALEAFERATEFEPGNTEAHFRVGLTRGALGLAGAISSYDRVLELQPNHFGAHLYRGIALATESPEEALGELDRASVLDPDDPHVPYWRAFVLHGLGHLDDAAIALDRALELGVDDLYPGLATVLRETIRNEIDAATGPTKDPGSERR